MRILLSLFLIAAVSPHARADDPAPCRTNTAIDMLDRALQARDDFFFWEDIDEREASADLDRYLSRLTRLQDFVTRCAPHEPEIAALQWRVRASLDTALDITASRRSAANREARTR